MSNMAFIRPLYTYIHLNLKQKAKKTQLLKLLDILETCYCHCILWIFPCLISGIDLEDYEKESNQP